MAKGKSSASSATRKKHARKAAGPDGFDDPQQQHQQGPKKPKLKKGEKPPPRVKQYIPPSKPQPAQPDPLETLGLASSLDTQLVVILRRLGKKDAVTRGKALEELRTWVDQDESLNDSVELAPVWLHHYPSLVLHPSRRIRLLASSMHLHLLSIPRVRYAIIFYLRETAESSRSESILGSWCLSAWDVDRMVSRDASRSWSQFISLGRNGEDVDYSNLALETDGFASSVADFLYKALLEPESLYLSIFPPAPIVSQAPPAALARRVPGRAIPIAPRIPTPEETSRKSELEEESGEDRKARLRVAALGGLKWIFDAAFRTSNLPEYISTVLQRLLSNPMTFSALHHAELPFWIPNLENGTTYGHSQPLVRRSAWSLVQSLSSPLSNGSGFDSYIPSLCRWVLGSAWTEPDSSVRASMWEPLLTFLTRVPNVWTRAQSVSDEQMNDQLEDDDASSRASDDEGVNEEDEELSTAPDSIPISSPKSNDSTTSARPWPLEQFLSFLQSGCGGSPVQGYPTLVVILSTIPEEILPHTSSALSDLFSTFWLALQDRSLTSALERERRDAVAAFLNSLLECVGVYARRLWSHERHVDATALVTDQWQKIWDGILHGTIKIPESVSGSALGKGLGRLKSVDNDLFRAAWKPISTVDLASISVAQEVNTVDILSFVEAQSSSAPSEDAKFSNDVYSLVTTWTHQLLQALVASESSWNDASTRIARIVNLLRYFQTVLGRDATTTTLLDQVFRDYLPFLLTHLDPQSFLAFFLAYISLQPSRAEDTWHSILSFIGSFAEDVGAESRDRYTPALSHLAAMDTQLLPEGVVLKARDELNRWVLETLKEFSASEDELSNVPHVRENDESSLTLLGQLVRKGDIFISSATMALVQDNIGDVLHTMAESTVHSGDFSSALVRPALSLAKDLVGTTTDETFASAIMPDVFLFVHLPSSTNPTVVSQASTLWDDWLSCSAHEAKKHVARQVRSRLKGAIGDVNSGVDPVTLLGLASQTYKFAGLESQLLNDIFPDPASFVPAFVSSSLLKYSPPPSLALLDRLVPSAPASESYSLPTYDSEGFSSYARLAIALLHAVSSDRLVARQSFWTIQHLTALEICARDRLAIPTARNPLFAIPEQSPDLASLLPPLIASAQQAVAYIMSSVASELSPDWHKTTTTALRGVPSSKQASMSDSVAEAVAAVYSASLLQDSVLHSRILYNTIRGLLREATVQESDLWLGLAQTIQDRSVTTTCAIVQSVVSLNLESPRVDRFRNELASRLSGVTPHKANIEGLKLLRLLDASAPPPDSDVVFLPQQRTVFMVQAFQRWIDDDDDLDEEVEAQLVPIFHHIVPIIQSVPGAHWDLIADLIEVNLEDAKFDDEDGLTSIGRTLQLLIGINELSESNKSLREMWQERQPKIYSFIKALLVMPVDKLPQSSPRDLCRGLVVSIAASATSDLVDGDSFTSLCHLLKDSSLDVRLTAHELLHQAAKKHTEKIVLEVEVDSSGDTRAILPDELVRVLESTLDEAQEVITNDASLPCLLGWMIAFDLFTDASPRVKTGYIEHLRNLGLVEEHLLPLLFQLLNIGSAGKPFAIDIWAVDEFVVGLYDDSSPSGIQVLAAHVYYRALMTIPALVRSWWLECKDRQLSNSVSSFTSSHFSPILVERHLSNIKQPHVMSELQDEALTVKIAAAIREVTVTYVIDEQQMEIGVKLPAEYPLKAVEIRDIKRVGVQEGKWRGWLFNVQQIAQSGLIVDALFWFKKNVSLHFEGKVECAICYSIISVMDRSLPNKPCKTCKNRFHSSCLYKWFHTSHSSSCPLCRSDIF